MCKGLEKIIKAAGSQRLAGEIVGVTQPAVAAWHAAGEVPYEKALLYGAILGMDLDELCPSAVDRQVGLINDGINLREQYADVIRRLREIEREEAAC